MLNLAADVSFKYMFTDALGSAAADYDAAASTTHFAAYDAYGNSEDNIIGNCPILFGTFFACTATRLNLRYLSKI